ncbi:hypothetical protein [Paraburkholderia domus]|nr:hypothetical protein [Paraburkholderia domus]
MRHPIDGIAFGLKANLSMGFFAFGIIARWVFAAFLFYVCAECVGARVSGWSAIRSRDPGRDFSAGGRLLAAAR